MCRLDRVTGIKSPAAPAMSIRTEKKQTSTGRREEETDWKKNYTIILGSAFLRYTMGLRHCDSTVNIIICNIQGVRVPNIATFVVSHILFLRIPRNAISADVAETVDL